MPALAAFVAAAGLLLAHAGGALGGSGGTAAPGGGGGAKDCVAMQFGKRALERGDCGSDVETLNWILRSRAYDVSLRHRFGVSTHDSVRHVQGREGLKRTGVVNRPTRTAIVKAMKRHRASWYGPGFWGNTTACGQTLKRGTVGVAHRSLPCGTKVVIGYSGRFLRTKVIDRGPYVKRRYERDWDLTQAAASRLGFEGVQTVRAAVIR